MQMGELLCGDIVVDEAIDDLNEKLVEFLA